MVEALSFRVVDRGKKTPQRIVLFGRSRKAINDSSRPSNLSHGGFCCGDRCDFGESVFFVEALGEIGAVYLCNSYQCPLELRAAILVRGEQLTESLCIPASKGDVQCTNSQIVHAHELP